MKNYLTLFALSLITLSATAQTDVAEQLKNVKAQLEEQVQRNDYLKEALALREGIQELTVNDITIKLTRVFAKDGAIVVSGVDKI
ncbi:hypothetical protein ACFX5U_20390 [Sphingobacterium sp. SG20118]|uniref:hypothetical protein n=1 Tax=Sphingobacterium sp. SG20118 TaxID=3367156 RepID=UPI0037DFC877